MWLPPRRKPATIAGAGRIPPAEFPVNNNPNRLNNKTTLMGRWFTRSEVMSTAFLGVFLRTAGGPLG